jgi:hypothetical protein
MPACTSHDGMGKAGDVVFRCAYLEVEDPLGIHELIVFLQVGL